MAQATKISDSPDFSSFPSLMRFRYPKKVATLSSSSSPRPGQWNTITDRIFCPSRTLIVLHGVACDRERKLSLKYCRRARKISAIRFAAVVRSRRFLIGENSIIELAIAKSVIGRSTFPEIGQNRVYVLDNTEPRFSRDYRVRVSLSKTRRKVFS